MSPDIDSKITLFFGTGDEIIPAPPFAKALEYFLVVLKELDSTVSKTSTGTLSWIVTGLSMESPAEISVAGLPPDQSSLDLGGHVARAFIHGAAHLEVSARPPEYFNERALKAIGGLSRSQRKLSGGIRARAADQTVNITEHISANVKALLKTSHSALGSIEGRLEEVNIHGIRQCRIYDAKTGIGIPCKFKEEQFEEVRDALSTRVSVYGVKTTDWQGRPKQLAVQKIRRLRNDEELPETLPKIKGFTDQRSSEQHIREMWNGGS